MGGAGRCERDSRPVHGGPRLGQARPHPAVVASTRQITAASTDKDQRIMPGSNSLPISSVSRPLGRRLVSQARPGSW